MANLAIVKLRQYFNPFIDAPARHFKTGVEIEQDVIKGLLNSQEIANKVTKPLSIKE